MPYSPELNGRAMLANIASIEIPPLTETLVDWLARQADAELARIGVARETDRRARLLPAPRAGRVLPRPARPAPGAGPRGAGTGQGTGLAPRRGRGAARGRHPADGGAARRRPSAWPSTMSSWRPATPARTRPRRGPAGSPRPTPPRPCARIRPSPWASAAPRCRPSTPPWRWPRRMACSCATPRACSSTTASPDTEGLRLALMSRKGLLPEADFFFPIPYEREHRLHPRGGGRARGLGAAGPPRRGLRAFPRGASARRSRLRGARSASRGSTPTASPTPTSPSEKGATPLPGRR